MKMNKGNITVESLIRIILIFLVIVVLFALISVTLKPSFLNIDNQKDNTEPGTKTIFDNLANMFGSCSDNDKRCVGNRVQTCVEGKWETSESCSKGCDKERSQCKNE